MRPPSDVVWREADWPFQWIGMHHAHAGGIRCNDRAEAERFMLRLCTRLRCAWTHAARLAAQRPAPAPAPTEES